MVAEEENRQRTGAGVGANDWADIRHQNARNAGDFRLDDVRQRVRLILAIAMADENHLPFRVDDMLLDAVGKDTDAAAATRHLLHNCQMTFLINVHNRLDTHKRTDNRAGCRQAAAAIEEHQVIDGEPVNQVLNMLLDPLCVLLDGHALFAVLQRSASFFGVPALKEAIAYFSAENLQGAAISIIIGAAVYLLIVLPLLTRKDEGGVRLYVNRWNEKLDLENAVYRPLLLTLLPQVLTLVFRFIAELPENLVMASRATIFRMRKTRKPVPVGNRFTYTLGRALNALARLLNRTILHRHPMHTDFEYVLDASFREVSSGIRSMSVSISFGLLLLCIGLYVTCLYLLQ